MDRARLARILWVVFAVVVWNVVFDRVLVLAGREYVFEAATAARAGSPYLLINNWMHPAVGRALSNATMAASGILAFGSVAIAFAARRALPPPPE